MIVVNGVRYACERCIRGHRVTSCNHSDQPLVIIKPRGRPSTVCDYCKELRISKNSHPSGSCTCGRQKLIQEKKEMMKKERQMKKQMKQKLRNQCDCHDSGNCKCHGSRKMTPSKDTISELNGVGSLADLPNNNNNMNNNNNNSNNPYGTTHNVENFNPAAASVTSSMRKMKRKPKRRESSSIDAKSLTNGDDMFFDDSASIISNINNININSDIGSLLGSADLRRTSSISSSMHNYGGVSKKKDLYKSSHPHNNSSMLSLDQQSVYSHSSLLSPSVDNASIHTFDHYMNHNGFHVGTPILHSSNHMNHNNHHNNYNGHGFSGSHSYNNHNGHNGMRSPSVASVHTNNNIPSTMNNMNVKANLNDNLQYLDNGDNKSIRSSFSHAITNNNVNNDININQNSENHTNDQFTVPFFNGDMTKSSSVRDTPPENMLNIDPMENKNSMAMDNANIDISTLANNGDLLFQNADWLLPQMTANSSNQMVGNLPVSNQGQGQGQAQDQGQGQGQGQGHGQQQQQQQLQQTHNNIAIASPLSNENFDLKEIAINNNTNNINKSNQQDNANSQINFSNETPNGLFSHELDPLKLAGNYNTNMAANDINTNSSNTNNMLKISDPMAWPFQNDPSPASNTEVPTNGLLDIFSDIPDLDEIQQATLPQQQQSTQQFPQQQHTPQDQIQQPLVSPTVNTKTHSPQLNGQRKYGKPLSPPFVSAIHNSHFRNQSQNNGAHSHQHNAHMKNSPDLLQRSNSMASNLSYNSLSTMNNMGPVSSSMKQPLLSGRTSFHMGNSPSDNITTTTTNNSTSTTNSNLNSANRNSRTNMNNNNNNNNTTGNTFINHQPHLDDAQSAKSVEVLSLTPGFVDLPEKGSKGNSSTAFQTGKSNDGLNTVTDNNMSTNFNIEPSNMTLPENFENFNLLIDPDQNSNLPVDSQQIPYTDFKPNPNDDLDILNNFTSFS